ncbi:unnamed protein product [Knipowitschia caucasica]
MLAPADSAEGRLQRARDLQEFLRGCREQLRAVSAELGWSCENPGRIWKCGSQQEMVQCRLDPNHKVPQRSLEKHQKKCLLQKMDYSTEEQEEMINTSFCYENTAAKTFVMDQQTQQEVVLGARSAAPLMRREGVFWQGEFSSAPAAVPQNHKRALCDLTVADRLALYNHVISQTTNQEEASSNKDDLYVDLVQKMQKEETQPQPQTQLELMVQRRDYKRRRETYRAKNVHITKKSYSQVHRDRDRT